MPPSLRGSFRSSKVPSVDVAFWVLKILSTAMGEATSDYFVHRFSPELAVLCAGVVFAVVLWWQMRATTYRAFTYWSAVVMVSVFGTMCADVVHVALGVPYAVSAIAFAALLTGVFVSWYVVEGTLSIHSIVTTRRELFYWTTVTVTFALGTAVGDLTAYTANLGFLKSGILFAGLIALPALLFAVLRAPAVVWFWCAYVITRPLGASFADWFGKAKSFGALGWGSGSVALVLSGVIVLGVAFVATRDRRITIWR